MRKLYKSEDIAKEISKEFLEIAKKSDGDVKIFSKKMFLKPDGSLNYDEMADFFAMCDRLITVMMRNNVYTEKTIDAACKIIFMLAAAMPWKHMNQKALADADSESIADPVKAYYRMKYDVFQNYLTAPDEIEQEIAEDDLRGYMLSIEKELNEVIHMCDDEIENQKEYLEDWDD